MTTPPSNASQASKSRGHFLFDLQAQRHGGDLNKEANTTILDIPLPKPPLRPSQSVLPPTISSVSQSHRKTPLTVTESHPNSNDTNVRLISVNPRPEPVYIKEVSSVTQPPSPLPPPLEPASTHLQETEFPLYENCPTDEPEDVLPTNTACAGIVEQAFDYLSTHDDDKDVIHEAHHDEQDDYSQSFDGDDNEDHSSSTNELDGTTTIIIHQQTDGKFGIFSSLTTH